MESTNLPLVSVPVITYNSSKYVLETLESIKAQTYQNIELIISDDCSKDNTVELCRKWIEENKERFVRTEIISTDINTGVSANFNRAEMACEGEWVKPIAGDDLLMFNCIEKCIDFMFKNPQGIFLFGKIETFGASDERNKQVEGVFDYSFFELEPEKQLERLILENNCVPASTFFYNKKKSIELGIKNDERIPLLEDLPKWINILQKGVKLYFTTDILVKYRVHEESISTTTSASVRFIESQQLFNYYYRYPILSKKNNEMAVLFMVKEYTDLYKMLIRSNDEWEKIQTSHAYRVGKFIMAPIKFVKRFFK